MTVVKAGVVRCQAATRLEQWCRQMARPREKMDGMPESEMVKWRTDVRRKAFEGDTVCRLCTCMETKVFGFGRIQAISRKGMKFRWVNQWRPLIVGKDGK